MTTRPMARVAGHHEIRMDGMLDVLVRASGKSVLDVGCNRGMVAYEFYKQGATLVHGCDNYAPGLAAAREIFADYRGVESKFMECNLSRGAQAVIDCFGEQKYDIVVVLATFHKLRRVMEEDLFAGLVRDLGRRTRELFCWRATSDKPSENDGEMELVHSLLHPLGLRQVHTSRISEELGLCSVWRRSQ